MKEALGVTMDSRYDAVKRNKIRKRHGFVYEIWKHKGAWLKNKRIYAGKQFQDLSIADILQRTLNQYYPIPMAHNWGICTIQGYIVRKISASYESSFYRIVTYLTGELTANTRSEDRVKRGCIHDDKGWRLVGDDP